MTVMTKLLVLGCLGWVGVIKLTQLQKNLLVFYYCMGWTFGAIIPIVATKQKEVTTWMNT
jgi:hypothetical protein